MVVRNLKSEGEIWMMRPIGFGTMPTMRPAAKPAVPTFQGESGKVVKGSQVNFQQDVLASDVPVLLDFYADWCGPCKRLAPILDKLADQYDGRLKIVKYNVEENRELAAKFNVKGVPALFFVKNQKLLPLPPGAPSEQGLTQIIDKVLDADI